MQGLDWDSSAAAFIAGYAPVNQSDDDRHEEGEDADPVVTMVDHPAKPAIRRDITMGGRSRRRPPR